MEKFYETRIKYLLDDLRKTLVTAICYYLDQERPIRATLVNGNAQLTGIEHVIDDRDHTDIRKTMLLIRSEDPDGLIYEKKVPLDKAEIEWLYPIYEELKALG